MKEVNLEEILSEYADVADGYIGYDTEIKDVLRAMKEACKQVLELAAENAHNEDRLSYHTNEPKRIIQSVLDTINQVK